MNYLTRRMRAVTELRHDGLVPAGGVFYCSPIDAGFYLARGKAVEAEAETPKAIGAVLAEPVIEAAAPPVPEVPASAEPAEPPAPPRRQYGPRRRATEEQG